MSFLGIAFEMGAVDAGMGKASSKATKNLDKINDLLDAQVDIIKGLKKQFEGMTDAEKELGDEAEKAAKKSDGGFSRIGKGLDSLDRKFKKFKKKLKKKVDSFNLANIAQNVKSLTGETGNLTNNLEGTMVSMMQAAKPVAAQLNLSSAEIRKLAGKAAGIAYGMNTNADSVMQTMASMRTANKGAKESMDAMRMSTQDWVKVVQTTGVPMEDFTSIMGDLMASWGGSKEQAASMLDNMVAIGKAAGTGILPLKGLKGAMDQVGELFQSLPPSMARSANEVQGLIESSGRLGGVFKAMGERAEDAVQMSSGVAKMFAEQAVHIDKALAMGDERSIHDNPLIKWLMRLGVQFEDARDIVSVGSRDTVAGMQRINAIYEKFGTSASTQVNRALSGLSGALGEGAAGLSYLASSTKDGTAALAEMAKMSVEGSGALKKFGKDAYSSGFTLQQTYNMAKEAFDTTIRSIARKQVVGLVQKQIAGMREAGKEIKALGSDETWGPFIGALSQFKQMGISGLFSSIAQSTGLGAKNASKFGAKMGLAMDTMKQLGDEISPVMQMLGMFGPVGFLGAGAGIAGLLMLKPEARKKILGPFAKVFEDIKAKAETFFADVNFDEMWTNLKGGMKVVFDGAKGLFKKLVDKGVIDDIINGMSIAFGGAVDMFPWQRLMEGITFVVGKLATKLSEIDWAPIVTGLVSSAKDIITAVLDGVGEAYGPAGQIGAAILGIMLSGGGAFMGVINNPIGGLLAVAGLAAAKFGASVAEIVSDSEQRQMALKYEHNMMKSGGKEFVKFQVEKDSSHVDKQLAEFEEVLAKERLRVFPDEEAVQRLERAVGIMRQAKLEVANERQEYNIGAYGGAAKIYEEVAGQMSMMGEEDWIQEAVAAGGESVAGQFTDGLTTGFKDPENKKAAEDALADGMASVKGNSPPVEGPFSGMGSENTAYVAGMSIMEQFAYGVTDSTDMIRMAVEDALDDSVILALDTYAAKMKELASKRTFLADVAKSMVRDITGASIETVDPEANVDVKKSFETAMSLPGLASVVLAVANEGAATRKMLKKIYDENVKQTVALEAMPSGGTRGAPLRAPPME